LGKIAIATNGPCVHVLAAGSWNVFTIKDAPVYMSEGVIAVHCEKDGKDEWLLIVKLVHASRTCMLKSPVWRIMVELSLDKNINMPSDVEVYIEGN
jgi:hypothetical protein